MDFPVWAKAISAQGTVKATLGSVNVPVTCAGQLIRPGDAVIGDIDGVVVVPREDVADVVIAGQQRIAKEEKNREKLRAGEAGLDMYGLRAKLKELGVVYVDQED
jgi:4-hydroxy-4-methyl-2-oxoglutarate aldolase